MGAMDTCTGILLVFAPGPTLELMGVPAVPPGALVFLSWMGVFITGVGLSYALVLRGPPEARAVWTFTSTIRLMVAGFLFWKIAAGNLGAHWALVAVTDALVGFGQLILLRAGWWKGAPS